MNFKSKCKTNRQRFKPCSDKILILKQEIKMNKRDNLKDILYLMGLTQILISQEIKPPISKPSEQDSPSKPNESEDSSLNHKMNLKLNYKMNSRIYIMIYFLKFLTQTLTVF